jgi:hypothetical protein
MGAPVQGLGDCRRFGVGGVDRHRPSVAGRPTREPVHAESRRRGNNGMVVSGLAVKTATLQPSAWWPIWHIVVVITMNG